MSTPRATGAQPAVLRLHDRCQIAKLGLGEVLFVGQTAFAAGVWVGVQLDEPNGKNNGVVQGKRYFDAADGHGVFVRASQVHVIGHVESDDEALEELYSEHEESQMDEQELMPPPPAPVRTPVSPVKRPAPVSRMSSATSTTSRPRSSLAPPRVTSPLKPGAARAGSTISGAVSPLKRAASSAASSSSGVYHSGQSRTSTPSAATARALRPGTQPAAAPRAAAGTDRTAAASARSVDATTARAALRPVPRTRPSMAPGGASEIASPARPALSRAHTGVPAASTPVARTQSRAGSALAIAPRTPAARLAAATASRQTQKTLSARRQSRDEDSESLMDASLDDASPGAVLSDHDDELSPSARRAALSASTSGIGKRDHMSLASTGKRPAGAVEVGALQREVDELKATARVLEKQRDEDRDRLRQMEAVRQENEELASLKAKMLTKQQELQIQVRDLYQAEKDWESERESLERQLQEFTDQVEMSILDKEMAEERAEALKEELDAERERVEELTMDVEVLTAEKALLEAEGVPEERSAPAAAGDTSESGEKVGRAPGYVQLEKQNERLKEALWRLRDLTSETEGEQKRRISELEKELFLLEDLQQRFETVSSRLEGANEVIEDLKEQLDDALSTEEMLVQLTDRNLTLSEKLEKMKASLQDAEAHEEVANELEEAHIETERQLQEEVDLKDFQLRELHARNELLEANIADNERMRLQFRELIVSLQSEIDAVRAQQRAAQEEGGTPGEEGPGGLANQSQAMLNLSMKLQSSALKSQAKTIELELGRLEASQAIAHLDMTRAYLPAAYFEADADAVNALLFFQRMAHKSELIRTIVEGNYDIAGALASVVPEHLIGICQMRNSLAHFTAVSRQIVGVLKLAPVQTFLKAGRSYREYERIERRIDQFIYSLRHEDLKEAECGSEFAAFVKEVEHFSLNLSGETEADLAAREVGAAQLIDLDLDTLIAALGFTKQTLAALYNEEETEWELGGKTLDDDVFAPLQELINNARSTKVPTRKLLRRLTSLYDNEEAVRIEVIMGLPPLGGIGSALVVFAKALARSVAAYTSEVRTTKAPFVMSTFIGFVADALRDGDMEPGSDDQIWDKALSSSAHLSSAIPPILAASLEQENVKKVLGSQPWLLRVEDIKAEAAHNVDAERQIAKLKEELREALLQINAREQKLQEGAIKLERLQKQVDRTKEQADDLSRLTQELSETQRRLKEYQAVHESLQADLEASERKNATLTQASAKSAASTAGEAQSGERAGGDEDAAAAAGLQRGYSSAASFESGYLAEQLEATRNVLSVVRAENCYLKSAGMLQQLEALPVLPSAPLKPSNAEDDAEAGTPRPRRAAESSAPVSAVRESKTLYAELLRLAASPRVITLPRVAPAPADGSAAAPVRTWRRLAAQPRSQLAAQQRERLELQARIERLADSVRSARRAPRGSDAAAGEGRQSADLLARLPTVPLLAQ